MLLLQTARINIDTEIWLRFSKDCVNLDFGDALMNSIVLN